MKEIKDYNSYKQRVDRTVFNKTSNRPIIFSKINIELLPEDIIKAGYEEPFYGSDSAHDGYYYLSVEREDWETEKEFNNRMIRAENDSKWAKERRRESYKKLKQEFENEDSGEI